ncbi:MAG: DNA topoisomerase IB [Actinobacteria bacterium]|nr:DNA topoisomerase IB [Actinomycetota bacterium]
MNDATVISVDAGTGRLRLGSDTERGIRRTGTTRPRYVDERTGRAPAAHHLERIRRLAVPPAWTDVWISADPDSHVQATGRDSRGRKQYRYHPSFVATRSSDKFGGLVPFGRALGGLRRQVERDLAATSLTHDHVVAVVVRLLDLTRLRVGNESYARSNRSFGLTTLRNRHVTVHGSTVSLKFRGKSAHLFDVTVDDPHLARIVRRCQHLPGQCLFQYLDESGSVRQVGSTDVNDYVGAHGAAGATAKTFRTWGASTLAAEQLARAARADEPSNAGLRGVIDEVAAALGNTPAVCRSSYIHPTIIDTYLDGTLPDRWEATPRGPTGLVAAERRLLRVLDGRRTRGHERTSAHR